jgi:hypothetical protein
MVATSTDKHTFLGFNFQGRIASSSTLRKGKRLFGRFDMVKMKGWEVVVKSTELAFTAPLFL